MAMIFTLVSVALEWLNERWDSSVKEKEDAEEKKRLQDEEEEHVCSGLICYNFWIQYFHRILLYGFYFVL